MMENLVWKAYYHSMSGHEIRPFNIFEHGRFREEVRKLLLKCTEKEVFAEELRRSLFYYYCSKCEWEVVIGPWCGDRGTKEIKVDVYMQVMNNWDNKLFVFLRIIIQFKCYTNVRGNFAFDRKSG